MKRNFIIIVLLMILTNTANSQNNSFERLNFVIGEWQGTGGGFGNETSEIQSSFQFIMNGKYIHIKNKSEFKPTDSKPDGEIHIDWGFVSFDKKRGKIVFRQFNIEGYVNQYVLNDSLSTDSRLVFETEVIENFVEGGRARWTIEKIDNGEIKTIFDVSFPGKEFSCYGTNSLKRK